MSENILEKQLFEIIKDKEMAEHIKLAKIDMLVRLGVDVNVMCGARSPLRIANEVNNQKVIEFLEEKGGKNIFDEETAKELGKKLIEVCANGEKKDVEELIDMGADVHQKDEDGKTALMRASLYGYKEVVELLIQNGADVNQKDKYGWTALMKAIRGGYKEIAEVLIKAGADVNQKNEDGWTALMFASYYGYKEIVEMLIKSGADVNDKNVNGYTALMFASAEGHKEILDVGQESR